MLFSACFNCLIPVYSESLNNLYNIYYNTTVCCNHIYVLHLNSMFTMSVYLLSYLY